MVAASTEGPTMNQMRVTFIVETDSDDPDSVEEALTELLEEQLPERDGFGDVTRMRVEEV